MSTATDLASDRNHFLLRRLHSLSGIIPIGAFLINHLLTNSTAWLGAERFDEHVEWLHSLPYLIVLELGLIILPIFFHAIYGIVIAQQGKSNAAAYPYMDNIRYTLQRVSGYVVFVFILTHLAHFQFAQFFGGPDYKEMTATEGVGAFTVTSAGFVAWGLPTWLWICWYLIGLLATIYHFCNGIVTFCITWGVTVNIPSRQKVSVAAAGLGVVLAVWGILALTAIVPNAEQNRAKVERAMDEHRAGVAATKMQPEATPVRHQAEN